MASLLRLEGYLKRSNVSVLRNKYIDYYWLKRVASLKGKTISSNAPTAKSHS